MGSLDADSLATLSSEDLRGLIVRLAAELNGFRATVARLEGRIGVLEGENTALREQAAALTAENRTLKDEIARLKELPKRPPDKPSGMEGSTEAGKVAKKKSRSRRRRGATLSRIAITHEVVLSAKAPAGSRFKGYEDIVVQDLDLAARATRYRRERWTTPSGETVSGALPTGILGGFGPDLQRFILALHIQGQVTTERMTALLTGMGVVISKRQVVRLLAKCAQKFAAEEAEVLRAGLATAPWITVDDTSARHGRRDGYTTQIGDDRFTAFRTSGSKSRANFLSILRAGSSLHVINAAALDYMRRRGLPEATLAALERADAKEFADADVFATHLKALGLTDRTVTPDPVAVASEGAMWGAIRHLGLLTNTVVVSDGAGQFRVGNHAACWIHAERLVHKLIPVNDIQHRAVDVTRQLIWWFYADLKAYRLAPHPKRAAAMRARFDRIFSRVTGFALLDQLLRRLHRQKADLLRVLERPEIPLHTNGSENDIRAVVTKRKVSGGTMSEAGRRARDILLGLMKTCRKLGVSFFSYLGCRLGVQGVQPISPLQDLVLAAGT
jgi:regulator of replication initiation timing